MVKKEGVLPWGLCQWFPRPGKTSPALVRLVPPCLLELSLDIIFSKQPSLNILRQSLVSPLLNFPQSTHHYLLFPFSMCSFICPLPVSA